MARLLRDGHCVYALVRESSDTSRLRGLAGDLHIRPVLNDDAALRAEQEATVRRLYTAARRNGLDFLLEIIPSKVGPVDDETTATIIRQFHAAGICPDWWKLEPLTSRKAWTNAIAAIEDHDRHTPAS